MDDGMFRRLIGKAMEAREFAYAPYSRFRVGAALLTKSQKIYTGCNVESASFSPTTCAERVAILKAVSEGEKDFSIIAVVGSGTDYAAPCGVCRQLLYEFAPALTVVIAKNPDEYQSFALSELLPMGFGPE
ncbi:MAG: cytidine deaminase, partial [Clostridiales bacterium]|nr:cytidine deaminase [Clostridiales bacterium]